MKINLNGTYREIERFVAAPASGTVGQAQLKGGNFASVLGDIAPERAKAALTDDPAPAKPPHLADNHGALASYKFDPAKALQPPLERLGSTLQQITEEDGAQQSVKTPSLLELRRIPHNSLSKAEQEAKIDQVRKLVDQAGKKHGVDPALSMAVVSAESGFNPQAVSSDGYESKGLFQLLDTTGKHLLKNSGTESRYNPFNPDLNVDLGVGYLRYLHDTFSQPSELPNDLRTTAAANSTSLEKLAVAAFNAGEGRVASAQMRANRAGVNPAVYEQVEPYLPDSTKEYVARVIRFKGDFAGPPPRDESS